MAHTTPYGEYIRTLKEKGFSDSITPLSYLPPRNPEMSLAGKLKELDTLKGWLDSFRPFPPQVVAELKKLSDVRFTYHSNAIEGNTLTQSETEMILEKGIAVGGKSLQEHLEVIGHKEAIDYIEELAKEETAIGAREIRDIHSLIMLGIDRDEAGRYRRFDVKAAGTEHVYPPHFRLYELMEGFTTWLSSPAAQNLHPVEYAGEAHYRFVSTHPFLDGNGRTGRLLMNLLLLRHGYPVAVITNERRKEYIDSLDYAQTHDDDTGRLTMLVADATRESLLESLGVLSTAAESRGKGLPFYQEMLTHLKKQVGEPS